MSTTNTHKSTTNTHKSTTNTHKIQQIHIRVKPIHIRVQQIHIRWQQYTQEKFFCYLKCLTYLLVTEFLWNLLLRGFNKINEDISILVNIVLRHWRRYMKTCKSFWTTHLELNLWFTKYHTTNKCTNCMSFILNHFFKTLFTAPTCFDSISLIIIREHIQFLAKITC